MCWPDRTSLGRTQETLMGGIHFTVSILHNLCKLTDKNVCSMRRRHTPLVLGPENSEHLLRRSLIVRKQAALQYMSKNSVDEKPPALPSFRRDERGSSEPADAHIQAGSWLQISTTRPRPQMTASTSRALTVSIPGRAGALGIGPLEAAVRVADAPLFFLAI